MLETVKKEIRLPFISFGHYFTQYVFDVQDSSIESESRFLFRHNKIDTVSLNKLMNEQSRSNLL